MPVLVGAIFNIVEESKAQESLILREHLTITRSSEHVATDSEKN